MNNCLTQQWKLDLLPPMFFNCCLSSSFSSFGMGCENGNAPISCCLSLPYPSNLSVTTETVIRNYPEQKQFNPSFSQLCKLLLARWRSLMIKFRAVRSWFKCCGIQSFWRRHKCSEIAILVSSTEDTKKRRYAGISGSLAPQKNHRSCHLHHQTDFYHAAVTKPLVRDLVVVEVSSPTAKKVSCSIIQLFSRPKISKSRMISQEPVLQRGWTLTFCLSCNQKRRPKFCLVVFVFLWFSSLWSTSFELHMLNLQRTPRLWKQTFLKSLHEIRVTFEQF